jgi:hypothetical protein
MFGKEFKNEDTDPQIPAVPKPEVKKIAEAWNTKPASVSAVDADSIIGAIKQNPDKSAVFKGCDSAIWNDVYKAVSKMKLHPKLKWNSDTQEISFR